MTTKKLTASSTTKMPGPFTSIDIDDEASPPRRKPSDGSTSTDVNSFRQPKDGGLTFATWQFKRTSLMSILLSVMSAVGCVMNAAYDLLVSAEGLSPEHDAVLVEHAVIMAMLAILISSASCCAGLCGAGATSGGRR